MIRVVVGARSTVVRAGLERLLDQDDGIEVIGSAESAAGVAALAESAGAAVIVCAVTQADTPESLRRTFGAGGSRVVYVGGAPPEPDGAGARVEPIGSADLPADATSAELSAAVRAVAAGLQVIHRSFLRTAAPSRLRAGGSVAHEPAFSRTQNGHASGDGNASGDVAREAQGPLTQREVQVLLMIAEGLPNKAIASELGITAHTVKFHIASIMQKLGAASRTEAVTIGLRNGFILL